MFPEKSTSKKVLIYNHKIVFVVKLYFKCPSIWWDILILISYFL